MSGNRMLVAGIGNIFMGDDGFGCEVTRRLAGLQLPDDVDVVDFGIRGMDLGYALMEGYALALLVDIVERGGPPGSVYVIEPEIDASRADTNEELLSPHGMDPAKVLRFIASLGDRRPNVLLVACEPDYLGDEHGHMGLSDAVEAAIDKAVAEVLDLLAQRTPAGTPLRKGSEFNGAQAPGGMS